MSVPLEIIVKSDIGTVVSDQQKIQQSLGQTAIAAQKASAAYEGYGVRSQKITDYTKLASGSLSQLGAAASKTSTEVSNVSSSLTSLGQSLITGGILAAIPLIVIGLQELGDKLFGLTAEQKAYNETLQNTVSDFAKANTQVAEMAQKVELAKNGFASKDQVVKEFNNTIGKTIGFAKDLNEAEALLIAKGPAYIQMMTLKSAATFALAKSGQLLAESIMLQIENSSSSNTSTSNAALKRLSGKIKEQSDIYRDLAAEFNKAAIKIATDAGLNVVDVEKPVKDAKEKIVRHVRDINDVLNDLKKNLAYLEFREVNLKTDEAKGKIAALESALAEIVKKFGKGAKNPIVIDLITRINVIKFEQAQGRIGHDESIEKQVQKELEHGVDVKIPVRVHLEVEEKQLTQDVAILQSTVANALGSIGESIGNSIIGNGNIFGNLFAGIFSALGAGLKQLGQYAIATSALVLSLKKSIGTTLGIAGGIAMIALGTIIQAAASRIKVPAFATGVRSFGGGSALVGERGPERIFLPAGSSVQPNNELNAYGGGGDKVFIPELIVRGPDLVIAFNRAQQQMSRNN